MDSKTKYLNLILIIESILSLFLSLWGYIYNQYIICLLPVVLLVFFLRWANQYEVLFNKKYYKNSFIIIAILSLFSLVILTPICDAIKNNLFPSISNIMILCSSVGYVSRIIKIGVLMAGLYILSLLFIFKYKDILKEKINGSDNKFSNFDFDEVFNRFIKARASSSKRTIKIDGEFDDKVIDYLCDNNVIIRNEKGKYYLDKEQMNILKDKLNNVSLDSSENIKDSLFKKIVIGFFVACFIILGIVSFSNKKEGENFIIAGKNYSFVLPEDYLITANEDKTSFTLIPENDISGESGYIYLSFSSDLNIIGINKEEEITSQIATYGDYANIVAYNVYDTLNSNGLLAITNYLTFENYYDDICNIYIEKNGVCTDIITIEYTYISDDSKVALDARELIDSISLAE